MTLGIVQGLEAVTRTVNNYISAENTPHGVLSDVKTILTGQKSRSPADPPAVWIVEHPTITADGHKGNLSHTNYLQTPFEFVCVHYDPDEDVASLLAKNLATRVGAAILKNFNRLKSKPGDPDRIFQSVQFNTLIPDGSVEIVGKSDSVPAAAIIFDFKHPISWLKCME